MSTCTKTLNDNIARVRLQTTKHGGHLLTLSSQVITLSICTIMQSSSSSLTQIEKFNCKGNPKYNNHIIFMSKHNKVHAHVCLRVHVYRVHFSRYEVWERGHLILMDRCYSISYLGVKYKYV